MKDIKIHLRKKIQSGYYVMPSILEVHHQQENMMVSNVACVITSYLLMVLTIRSNPELFATCNDPS
jgi:hypothetical protein